MSQYFAFVSEVNIISLLALKFFPFWMSHCKENKETEEKPFLIEHSNATKKKTGTYICYQSIEKTRRHWFLSEILKATNWFENIVPLWLPHSFHSIHFQLVCCNFDAVFVPFSQYTFVCVSNTSLFLRMWKEKSIMRSLCVCVCMRILDENVRFQTNLCCLPISKQVHMKYT